MTPNIPAFEADFQAACRRQGVSAAFIAIKSSGEKGSAVRVEKTRAAVEAMAEALEEAAAQAEADAAKLHYSVHGQRLAEKAKGWRELLARYHGRTES